MAEQQQQQQRESGGKHYKIFVYRLTGTLANCPKAQSKLHFQFPPSPLPPSHIRSQGPRQTGCACKRVGASCQRNSHVITTVATAAAAKEVDRTMSDVAAASTHQVSALGSSLAALSRHVASVIADDCDDNESFGVAHGSGVDEGRVVCS